MLPIVDAIAVFPGINLEGDGDILNNVMCIGNETEIANCPSDPIGPQSCASGHAGVRCRGNLQHVE